jgi:hypothetical protein
MDALRDQSVITDWFARTNTPLRLLNSARPGAAGRVVANRSATFAG